MGITEGTREWSVRSVNCLKGCPNGCRYCYAAMIADRFGWKKKEEWTAPEVNRKAVIRRYGRSGGTVMFPTSHDIPVGPPELTEACLTVLGKLLKAGNRVLLVSKPHPEVIGEICKRFGDYRNSLLFRFTITATDPEVLRFWEPGAPSFSERVRAIRTARRFGFGVSVSIEPFPEDPKRIIDKVKPLINDTIWVGPMNHFGLRSAGNPEEEKFYRAARELYRPENLYRIFTELGDDPVIRFKDAMLNRLGAAGYTPHGSRDGKKEK